MDPAALQAILSAMDERQAQNNQQITSLIEALQFNVTVQQAAPDANATRAAKIQKIAESLRKGSRVKDFKNTNDSNIRTHIKKFENELKSLKQMVGIMDDLSRDEYVPMFRANLEFSVLVRVEQVFKCDPNNIKTWDIITIPELHALMIREFGQKYTDVANVLGQFGPSRLSKSADKSVSEFYYDWLTQIPDIMKPTTPVEFTNFADLILRAMFYISLNDAYLQKALSDLKEPNPTIKSYLDEAIAAESRRKCFNDNNVSSNALDSSGG